MSKSDAEQSSGASDAGADAVKPTRWQRFKAHMKKWWWVYLIIVAIVVLVVVLPL